MKCFSISSGVRISFANILTPDEIEKHFIRATHIELLLIHPGGYGKTMTTFSQVT